MTVLGLGIITNNYLGHIHHNVLGYSTNVSESALLEQTNTARLKNGEKDLVLSQSLTAAAQAKANDMVRRNYWSHVTPDGQQPWTFIAQNGYQYQAAGENLAYGFGTSSQIVSAWIHSKEHKANMLNASYSDVGFAVANSSNFNGTGPETVVVAYYAMPIGTVVTSDSKPPIQLSNTAQVISRAQLASGGRWSEMLIAALCGAAIAVFFVRHSLAWKKVLVRGEEFALHHPFLDLLLMTAVVVGLLLGTSAGSIL